MTFLNQWAGKAALFFFSIFALALSANGQSIPNNTYTSGQLFQPLSQIDYIPGVNTDVVESPLCWPIRGRYLRNPRYSHVGGLYAAASS